MKKEEVRLMLEEIDDGYILDALTEFRRTKLTVKQRFVRVCAAAVVILLVGSATGIGISILERGKGASSGSLDRFTQNHTLVQPTYAPSDSLSSGNSKGTEIDESKEDYEQFFQNEMPWTEGADGMYGDALAVYSGQDAVPVYIDGQDIFTELKAEVYYGEQEQPLYTKYELLNRTEQKSCSIVISDVEPYLLSSICESGIAVERYGISVYGAQSSDSDDEYPTLMLCFVKENQGIRIITNGMSYDETGRIMDSLIRTDMDAEKFDQSKGSWAKWNPALGDWRAYES